MINLFDFVVVIIILGLAVYGFHEGLLRGAIKLVGFIVVIVIMASFSGMIVEVALYIKKIPPKISIPLAFLVIFILGTASFYVIANVFHRLVHMTPAGFIDNGLGCAFGALKALILCGLLATLISFAPQGSFFKNQYEKSIAAASLATLLSEAIPLVKKTLIPLYHRFTPLPSKPGNKYNETIPQEFI